MASKGLAAIRAAQPTYVYRCFDKGGELLYVGASVNPRDRIQTHYRKPWGRKIAVVWVRRYATRRTAMNAERRAICFESPRHNMNGLGGQRAIAALGIRSRIMSNGK